MTLDTNNLILHGAQANLAASIAEKMNDLVQTLPAANAWNIISKNILQPSDPFTLHHFIFITLFPDWPNELDSAPAYIPDEMTIAQSNLTHFMSSVNISDLKRFHQWTTTDYEEFLSRTIQQLNIQLDHKPSAMVKFPNGIESPQWLNDAKLNIVNSCFNAPKEKTAIISSDKNGNLSKLSYEKLEKLTNAVAYSLQQQGFLPGDAIAIGMPMSVESIAIYLGIIKMGGMAVSIAESFSATEIATRLNIAKAKAVFTQDHLLRDQKKLPLYEKFITANAPRTIVLNCENNFDIVLRKNDLPWKDFLREGKLTTYSASPMEPITILFSSGTTGTPKAIPWNHTTAIKSASDAYFHQDIHPDDILSWPTSLGWMMGPWLIFATFINQATLAIYHDLPKSESYGQFVQDAKITMLGVVPTLVSYWKKTDNMRQFNWTAIKKFTSTAECSNPEDMLYLMSLASYPPVIEYCGGTEIGGAYVTSTVIETNYPSVFTTPAMGLNFLIIDEQGQATNNGEVAIVPPAIGLSTELLNANHHDVYYDNMPQYQGKILRRHGDQICQLKSGNFSVLGRMDDTMNLGGIKVSSAEIERTVSGITDISESAAIGVNTKNHGPSNLVIYAATTKSLSKDTIKKLMQEKINLHLNPLFKIDDVVFISELPKTASNKIMRRILRDDYFSSKS